MVISYEKDIIKWLHECVKYSAQLPIVRESIIQYINHIQKLTNTDMTTSLNDDLVGLLSKPENIEYVFKINESINLVKSKVITDMAIRISKQLGLNYYVSGDCNGIGFSKDKWRKGSKIFFAEDKGKVYYSLKTPEAGKGVAQIKPRISDLFYLKQDKWNPYGYGHVYPEHWTANYQVFKIILDHSFENEHIIPRLEDVLKFLGNHPEIEQEL